MKQRLDRVVTDRGLAGSRERAKALIMEDWVAAVTTSTPFLIMPAFSPAISGSVFPSISI